MHSLNVRAQDLDGVHRIGLAVEDEIGGVEVHSDIVQPDVANRPHQRDGRLLAGLAAEFLAVLPAVRGHRADGVDGFLVGGSLGFSGMNPQWPCTAGILALAAKSETCFHAGDALRRGTARGTSPMVSGP